MNGGRVNFGTHMHSTSSKVHILNEGRHSLYEMYYLLLMLGSNKSPNIGRVTVSYNLLCLNMGP